MKTYNITTPKGIVECYECNGIYFPLSESNNDFLYESILDIELV